MSGSPYSDARCVEKIVTCDWSTLTVTGTVAPRASVIVTEHVPARLPETTLNVAPPEGPGVALVVTSRATKAGVALGAGDAVGVALADGEGTVHAAIVAVNAAVSFVSVTTNGCVVGTVASNVNVLGCTFGVGAIVGTGDGVGDGLALGDALGLGVGLAVVAVL
jgi:hypothetical protein